MREQGHKLVPIRIPNEEELIKTYIKIIASDGFGTVDEMLQGKE